MERVSILIALREVARIGLLARGAEPHAPGLWGRAAFRRFEELDKLAPDKKQLLKESPEK